MTSCPHPPTHCPTVGPITQARDAADYLEQHNVTGLLDGMMAGLMMALPDDHVDFMQRAVNTAREMGAENVDLQTFVGPLHPHRDPIRRKLFNPPVPVCTCRYKLINRTALGQRKPPPSTLSISPVVFTRWQGYALSGNPSIISWRLDPDADPDHHQNLMTSILCQRVITFFANKHIHKLISHL